MSERKKLMYLQRRAPHGTIHARESLEVVLMGAAFDHYVSLMFIDDGVYLLVEGSDTSAFDVKNFMPAYRTLGDYGVRHIYVDRDSLAARGLTIDDLIEVYFEDWEINGPRHNIVEVLDAAQVTEAMEGADVVFSF